MAAPADSWLGSQPHRASLQHNTLESDNLSHDDMMSQMGSLLKDLSRGEDGIRKFLAAGEGAEVPAGVPQIVKQSVPLEQLLGSLQDLLFVVEGAMPVQSPIPSHMSSPRSPGNPAVNSQTIRTPGYPSARNSYAPPATKPPPPPGVLFYDSIPERFSRLFRLRFVQVFKNVCQKPLPPAVGRVSASPRSSAATSDPADLSSIFH
jgi:hypothetical protein